MHNTSWSLNPKEYFNVISKFVDKAIQEKNFNIVKNQA